MLGDEVFTHVRRPEVFRGFNVTTKPLLKLVRMVHVSEGFWSVTSIETNFCECFWIDEGFCSFEEQTLSPAHIYICAFEHKEHEVGLTNLTKGHDLLAWQRGHRQIAKVADDLPLLSLSWQKHYFLNIHEKKCKHVCEDLHLDGLRLLLIKLGHQVGIHDKGWSVVLVSAKDIKAARLEESDGQRGQLWLGG